MPYLVFFLLGIVLLALAGVWYEQRAERFERERIQPPGRWIDLGGRRLHLRCLGERRPGQPLVILESGHGDWSVAWRKVQGEIAKFARVCAYDRAGFGFSDPGPLPRTPERLVSDLHDLLERAGEPGPYLFVGHSMGAPLGRLFAHRYPGEVTGMVWVDSAHERMDRFIPSWRQAYFGSLVVLRAAAGLARLGLLRLFGKKRALAIYSWASTPDELAALLAQVAGPRFFDTLREETIGMLRADAWPEDAQSLGDLPVIMLETQYPDQPPRGYPPARWQQFRAGWQAIQADVSCLSTRVKRVPAGKTHKIMDECPDLVIQAVRELLI